jgi:hypothetical protein
MRVVAAATKSTQQNHQAVYGSRVTIQVISNISGKQCSDISRNELVNLDFESMAYRKRQEDSRVLWNWVSATVAQS